MTQRVLPGQLVGEFLGVGSVGESDPKAALPYVKRLKLPYAYQVPRIKEEDMIRQFGSLVEGFEEKGDYILDLDLYAYQEMTQNGTPLIPDQSHAHGLYLMMDGSRYEFFKTQQTAPATMCFSTRGSDGRQLVSQRMFHFYSSLMTRVAKGQVEHLSRSCKTVFLCQDDPALGFVVKMIRDGRADGLTLRQVIDGTEKLFPKSVVPAYHYCDDWRLLSSNGSYILWDGVPKIVHIDVLAFRPEIDPGQAESINSFMERGGALGLGVLPNVDDAYITPVTETLRRNLKLVLESFQKSTVSLDLLHDRAMISTQCGLSRASSPLSKEIHEKSNEFRSIFEETIKRLL